MHPTRNDRSPKVRSQCEQLLNARLADALDLQSATQQAHCNVKGPSFIAPHELFDELHGNVEEHVDTQAERITPLADRRAHFGRKIRAGIDVTDKIGDADSADRLTGISRDVDNYQWFLQAHRHGKG